MVVALYKADVVPMIGAAPHMHHYAKQRVLRFRTILQRHTVNPYSADE